jgi:hypothetical protein
MNSTKCGTQDQTLGGMIPDPNELPPPNGLTKVILQTQRDQAGNKVAVFAGREDDGRILGAVVGQTVKFGCGDSIVEYTVLDEEYGLDFLKELCCTYLNRDDVDFLVREAPKPVQVGMAPPSRIHKA